MELFSHLQGWGWCIYLHLQYPQNHPKVGQYAIHGVSGCFKTPISGSPINKQVDQPTDFQESQQV